jgi:small subunit ribosomal protein S8
MPVSDPIADLLTRIRNAGLVRHPTVELPSSKAKVAIVEILKREGFVQDFEVAKHHPQDVLRLRLRYGQDQKPAIAGLKRVSKPSVRVHVQRGEVPRLYGGVGISIISTSQGVMTGREAWRKGLGGELMCYVW